MAPWLSSDLLLLARQAHAELATERRPPRTLTADQDALFVALAERILPRTDTPGATDARVNEFVDLVLTDWYEDAARRRFLDGLARIDARSRELFGTRFVEAREPQQAALLTELDADLTRMRGAEDLLPPHERSEAPSTRHFFHMLKRLTLFGYFTSEVGCPPDERHLAVVYEGCAVLPEVRKLLEE